MTRRATKSKSRSPTARYAVVGAKLKRCISCQGTRIVRKGVRRK